uniref:Kunitz-type serine protease inhibitor n=1 Tax=Amblyomma americanum TaxID=6943 RepID=B5M7A7_AMBAM
MKFLAIALLWCWSGAALGVGGGIFSTQEFNWPRNFSRQDCEQKESLVGKHCGNPFHERRYFYNRTTKKCVLFIPEQCGDNYDVGNNFAKRHDCMKTCMEGSPCLKPRKGRENGTVKGYTYYASVDFCFKVKYMKKQFSPAKNRFETEKDCYDECAPEIVPKNWQGK